MRAGAQADRLNSFTVWRPAATTLNASLPMNVVALDHVCKEYALGRQMVRAVDDVSLTVGEGEFLALAGPSGSGKSTLLNLIGCIDTPTSGEVLIRDEPVGGKSSDELADLRATTIGFVFQSFNLLPVLTAAENIDYPLLNRKEIAVKERRERVAYYLSVVGLERFGRHRPSELSGGQRQRVAIARALASRPAIVLADEPTANLDHRTGEEILRLMKQINERDGTTFVFSTHDPKVMALADRILQISDGKITT
jgi:putative ABC transport system ATP-binding protein